MEKVWSKTVTLRSLVITCSLILLVRWQFSTPHAFGHHHGPGPVLYLLLLVVLASLLYIWLSARTSVDDSVQHDGSSSAKKDACPKALRRLMHHLDNKHPYLDEHLSLPLLAEQVGMPVHVVSRTINSGLGLSYSELISQRRIAWAQRQLAKAEHRNTKIIAIAWDAGFTSKSAFYNAFKKYTGLSPAAFRKQIAKQKKVRDHN